MKIGPIKIPIIQCIEGIYLRWWFNGWHYFNFQNGYEISMTSESMDTQVTRMFSVISKIERPTKLKAEYSYQITLEGISAANISGFAGLLLAERVEQYEGAKWYEVEITRGDHLIKDENAPGYILNFEITRKERPYSSTVLQKTIKLYLGDILCDLDDDEVIPINKQVNDIAEMQDRQSDFTAQFKIRKTRAMRALFELSGEVGANTTFPYENQTCHLIQDSIEMITDGIMVLDKVDDQYYYVSILSGNLNFFKAIDKLKLVDLTLNVIALGTANHTWDLAGIVASHATDLNYVYPLCEPSDDASMAVGAVVTGNTVNMYGGYIWPFVKVKIIWDEIFLNSGYSCEGDILTDPIFLKLFMPITSLEINKAYINKYLYSLYWNGSVNWPGWTQIPGGSLINGDVAFSNGSYNCPFIATYKIKIIMVGGDLFIPPANIRLYSGIALVGTFTRVVGLLGSAIYNIEYTSIIGGEVLTFQTSGQVYYYSISIVDIIKASIAFASPVTPHINLPDLTQVEFIKMICNMFGLIPDVTPRDKRIRFWNYSELYDNIPIARDWSAYLSEREDETEFKFGNYAQNNYLKYKESEDVIPGNGDGIMEIDDETLPEEKDVVTLPISTCDEMIIATTIPTTVSRIAMNTWNDDVSLYTQAKSIDPRIVYIKEATGREFIVWDDQSLTVNHQHITNPKIASSIEVSFSYLVTNYAWLSRLLTKTNLRRAKFNLPVYEVAGLKHYIPIYLSQYKAYFYVNKINNFVPGQLCTIDLIKL